jgi:hypothetical protein
MLAEALAAQNAKPPPALVAKQVSLSFERSKIGLSFFAGFLFLTFFEE